MKKILLVAVMLFMMGCDGKPSGQSGKDYYIDMFIKLGVEGANENTNGKFDQMGGIMKAQLLNSTFKETIPYMFKAIKNVHCNEDEVQKYVKNHGGTEESITYTIALIPELCENGVYVELKEQALIDYAKKRIDDRFIEK